MKLRIAARSSDLARIQAISVGEALRKSSSVAGKPLEIEYAFRQSLGDIHLNDPLWKMPEKGVFTEDFRADLLSGACDLVVHSWKDLPIDARTETAIVATLPRADFRDLLLFKRRSVEKILGGGASLRILSSSPRRAYNLAPFLRSHLPHRGAESSFEFFPVRGNVPTRVRKWLEGEADGLIVAKAALDRLLEAEGFESRAFLRSALRDALFMVLPASENPPAAAQGALAIEIRSDRADLRELLARVNCPDTFRSAALEREILKGYGGGCHQKIGVAVLPRPYGIVQSLRGLTDGGKVLDEFQIRPLDLNMRIPRAEPGRFWPDQIEDRSVFFDRTVLPAKNPGGDLWVARADALPSDWTISSSQIVWTSGTETWKKLAARGIWVSGSAESLGEGEAPRVETVARACVGRDPAFTKLSHREGHPGEYPVLPTYELRPREIDWNRMRDFFLGKSHFFWMSGSLFEYCLEKVPEIRTAHHSCGPGNTYATLKRVLGESRPIGVFVGFEEWKKEVSG